MAETVSRWCAVRDTTVSRSYAEALFELGERSGQQAAFSDAVEEFASLRETDEKVRRFLDSPKIEAEAKKRVLRRTLEGRAPKLFLNFLCVALDKRRQRLLGDIAHEYRALLDEHLGRLRVSVTLASEPDEKSEEEIASDLSRALGKTVIPQVRVDPEILGGVVVRYGDRVLDGSLRRRLLGMRRRMLEADLPGPARA